MKMIIMVVYLSGQPWKAAIGMQMPQWKAMMATPLAMKMGLSGISQNNALWKWTHRTEM